MDARVYLLAACLVGALLSAAGTAPLSAFGQERASVDTEYLRIDADPATGQLTLAVRGAADTVVSEIPMPGLELDGRMQRGFKVVTR